MDTYLKAADESSLWVALDDAGVVDFLLPDEESAARYVLKPGYALDVIGTIYQPIGVDANDEPIMGAIPGFHANLRGDLSAEQLALLPAIPAPANPVRVWAS